MMVRLYCFPVSIDENTIDNLRQKENNETVRFVYAYLTIILIIKFIVKRSTYSNAHQ